MPIERSDYRIFFFSILIIQHIVRAVKGYIDFLILFLYTVMFVDSFHREVK